jgi:hypothetical protein
MVGTAPKGSDEAWFQINERLEGRAATRLRLDTELGILCDCEREECTDRIEILFRDHERVRSSSATLVIVPSHADPTRERVVSSADRLNLVEEFWDAAQLAEVENPRCDEATVEGGSRRGR